MEIEIKKVTGWFGLKEKNGLIENPDKDNINKSDVVLVANNSGEVRSIRLIEIKYFYDCIVSSSIRFKSIINYGQ